MQTCPNCQYEVKEGALFCTNCGTKLSSNKHCLSCGEEIPMDANFCPKCSAPQKQAEDDFKDTFKDLKPYEIHIDDGYYACDNMIFRQGFIEISPIDIYFHANRKGFKGIMGTISAMGMYENVKINYKDITHMSIMEKGQALFLQTSYGNVHIFGSPSLIVSKNRTYIKQLGYIIELYRRMYWWYGEYVEGGRCGHLVPIGNFKNEVENICWVSNEDLINFYKYISKQ